ncbi:hypothetical protein CMO96_01350 [Candidatus Woesebacteria bacterium]|nr:hypothetical protein [Candidatus Woesebacteria bacterium]
MNEQRKTVALIIWLCEGTKPRRDKRWKNAYLYPIEVINSNPKILKIFIDFLLIDLKVPIEKLHGQIQIHQGDDQNAIEDFWSESTGIPKKQFNKTIVRPKGNKPGKNLGTFKVRLYDRKLYKRLENMLKLSLAKI